MESIVVLEKPTPRVPLADWHGKVWELRQTCDTRRLDALNLRSESKQLINESDSRTNWDSYHNNTRITNRLMELDGWREIFTLIVEAVDKEHSLLSHEKALTEAEIEFLGLNFGVVNECLTQRDQRGGADLCTDSAELEVKHELKVLESLKTMLTKKCQTAWEQMNELIELKFKIIQDLQDKNRSIQIDTDNLDMDRHGANISNKMDPTRLPPSMISYESWQEHCKFMKQKADSTLEESQKIRESMYVPRERARNDLKAQNDATNFAMRKRIYETQRIKNELDWQRLNMVKDMEKLHKEIDNLEKAFENKTNALKLAETRSENRLYRPGKECCRDDVAVGLEQEIVQLRKTKAALEDKLNQARATYNSLEEQLVIVDRELFNKNHALTTDLRCLDLRNRLSRGTDKKAPDTQTDRNIELTRMQDEIPPEN